MVDEFRKINRIRRKLVTFIPYIYDILLVRSMNF